MDKVEHLYLHVPFCAAKCRYCAFYSEPGHTEKMGAFVEAITTELQPWVNRLAPKTIFIGGGTPSVLPANLLRQLFAGLPRNSAFTEWTVECNPATVTPEKLAVLREAGVNRISLGVQAFDDTLLQTLGRIHTAAAAVATYRELRAAGFENLNLDLMFGLPGQTLEQWCETLQCAIELQPEHLSTYCLSFEEDTEFWKLFQAGHLRSDADRERAMYEFAIDTLAAAGYRQYEISNFAKPGRECRHNIAGWEGRDYLGTGPSACSTVDNRRWQNISDIDRYVAGNVAPEFEEQITPALRSAERAAFGMRMIAGVPAEVVHGRFDRQVAKLISTGLACWHDGRLCPTRRGILFADEVAMEFV